MAEPEDVQMTEASSRSSSLSPPPSSLPGSVEDFHGQELNLNAPASEKNHEPPHHGIQDQEISLEAITLGTPCPDNDSDNSEPMVQTRRQAAAERARIAAEEAANAPQPPLTLPPPRNTGGKTPPVATGTTKKRTATPPPDVVDSDKPKKKPTRTSTRTNGANKGPKAQPAPKTKPKTIQKKPTAPRRRKWTAERLLTDPNSPLANVDIRTLLCKPAAWDILTAEEKAEIARLAPPTMPMINANTDDMRPDTALLASDNNFRADCAAYANHLGRGFHDPAWIREAFEAHERRLAGDFDEYLEAKFNEKWGEE